MKRWLTPSLVALALTGCSQLASNNEQQANNQIQIPGVKFEQAVTAKPGEVVIPYKKYQLDNGLTLILHEDHSDPLVHVDVTYHVGSGREELGKSGFAHFFEHMMFQGSEHVADEQHFKIVTEAGGTMNGTTNSDRTNYFETVPANQLEKMLWLEADRMGFLLDAVTQEKFEVQRETVKNERGQRIDNRPYGRLRERVAEAMYPHGHPYSWPVIGYMEDLNRVNVNDLKAFFLRWYGPNNATLTIGGDIDPKQTIAWVKKYFGTIPRGPEVDMPKKERVVLNEDRYISMEDNVHLPLVYMSYPTVWVRHEDEAPLDVLSSILGGGKTSLLYKNLVKTRLAVQANVSHPCAELACTFNLLALPHPASGKSLADLEKIIRDTLVEFEQRGVTDEDLTKVKADMKANFIFGLQSVRGKVSQLAANETFTHNPNYIKKDIERYQNVTKEDVMRVFNKYIKGQHAVIMSIVPKGKLDMIAHADTYTPPKREIAAQSTTSADDLVLRKAQDNFDRSIMPTAPANDPVHIPAMWKQKLANGIKVLGAQSTETPTTSMLLKIPAGHYYESVEKTGTARLMAAMLNESTLKRSAEQMSQALQLLGSNVSISAGNQYIAVNINSLTENLAATLDLVKEKLLEPAFDAKEFERIRNNAIQGIKNNKRDAGYLARVAYNKLMFGNSIAGVPSGGTEASLAKLSVMDIRAFYQKYMKPSAGQLILVSDLDKNQVMPMLAKFEDWQGQSQTLDLELPQKATGKAGTIYLVNKTNAAQSAIRIGKRDIKYDVMGDFYQNTLMNFALGGAFNSRINLNLREDKGYTYGARSYFWGDKFAGGYTARAEVRADATDKSVIEFIKEIDNYATNGITDEELRFMRNAINQRDALKYETPRAKLGFLAQILEYNLAPSFVSKRNDIVANISKDKINQLAKQHLNSKEMFMVIVGDEKSLKPKLEKLGYKVESYQL